MPQPFNNAVMTNAGARLLTRAQAGEIKIEFTRIAVGNGNYTGQPLNRLRTVIPFRILTYSAITA